MSWDPLVQKAILTLGQAADDAELLKDADDLIADWNNLMGQPLDPNDEANLSADDLRLYAVAIVRKSRRDYQQGYWNKTNLRTARDRVRAR